jgi:hypothetical protein
MFSSHEMLDCIVTSGGIEEELMKCSNDIFLGDFNMDDKENLISVALEIFKC